MVHTSTPQDPPAQAPSLKSAFFMVASVDDIGTIFINMVRKIIPFPGRPWPPPPPVRRTIAVVTLRPEGRGAHPEFPSYGALHPGIGFAQRQDGGVPAYPHLAGDGGEVVPPEPELVLYPLPSLAGALWYVHILPHNGKSIAELCQAINKKIKHLTPKKGKRYYRRPAPGRGDNIMLYNMLYLPNSQGPGGGE